MKKKCHLCLQIKPLIDFHKCKNNADGLQFVCKDCRRAQGRDRYKLKRDIIIAYTYKYRKLHRKKWLEYSEQYRIKNRLAIRVRAVLGRYNLTLEEYQNTFSSQEEKCAICGIKDFSPKIDHDHKTGKVRGILCFNCNCALGAFKDNISTLERAIEYLKK